MPERVIEAITLCAEREVSSVPKEPRAGVATVQSPVSFGHPRGKLPPDAEGLEVQRGAAPDHLLARRLGDLAHRRAGEELQIVDLGGEPEQVLAA